ncbi:MAG: glutathione peroxidase [Bacteroidales bacterium]|jgi:glutathione peroxidase|nr:glutathione peroxidase [Bacteroidales bacterium]
MKRNTLIIIVLLFTATAFTQESGFYSFKVKTLEGDDFDMSALKGKKVMIVNTASKCGFTPQYKDLEELYERYGDKIEIIGFPANNFANQEPGTAEEIRQFCSSKFGVTFPLMEKISVKGNDIHPLYQWLTMKSKNGVMDSEVKWNFQKYLVDEKGNLTDVLYSIEKPGSEKVINWLLNK